MSVRVSLLFFLNASRVWLLPVVCSGVPPSLVCVGPGAIIFRRSAWRDVRAHRGPL